VQILQELPVHQIQNALCGGGGGLSRRWDGSFSLQMSLFVGREADPRGTGAATCVILEATHTWPQVLLALNMPV